MNWKILTDSQMPGYLAEEQMDLIARTGQGTGTVSQFDRFAPSVIARIRSAVSSGGGMVSATANTVPPECEDIAYWLIIERMLIAIPGLTLTDDQKTVLKDSKDFLELVRKGEASITKPDDPEEIQVQTVVPEPSIRDPHRHFRHRDEDGI